MTIPIKRVDYVFDRFNRETDNKRYWRIRQNRDDDPTKPLLIGCIPENLAVKLIHPNTLYRIIFVNSNYEVSDIFIHINQGLFNDKKSLTN